MPAELKVVPLNPSCAQDIPGALRALAERIETGGYGFAVHNVGWVMDCGDGRVEIGLLGAAPEPGATGHLLFALGQRKLEGALP